MAYRLTLQQTPVEMDTPAEVHALIGYRPTEHEPSTTKPARAMRGASPGSLDGRILDALKSGALAPKELVAAVKSDASYVRQALTRLREAGKVTAEGATLNRRWRLK